MTDRSSSVAGAKSSHVTFELFASIFHVGQKNRRPISPTRSVFEIARLLEESLTDRRLCSRKLQPTNGNFYALRPSVERERHSSNHPNAKEALIECPTCHFLVPAWQLTTFTGRRMCRNCASAWYDEDEAEKEKNPDSRD